MSLFQFNLWHVSPYRISHPWSISLIKYTVYRDITCPGWRRTKDKLRFCDGDVGIWGWKYGFGMELMFDIRNSGLATRRITRFTLIQITWGKIWKRQVTLSIISIIYRWNFEVLQKIYKSFYVHHVLTKSNQIYTKWNQI